MRYVVAMVLLAIGVVLLGVAGVAYLQLNAMAAEVAVPKMEDYPAVNLVASDLWSAAVDPRNGTAPKPYELAQQTRQRIWLLGFAGLIMAVLGLMAFAVWPKPHHSEGT